jgi:hypothetical protein
MPRPSRRSRSSLGLVLSHNLSSRKLPYEVAASYVFSLKSFHLKKTVEMASTQILDSVQRNLESVGVGSELDLELRDRLRVPVCCKAQELAEHPQDPIIAARIAIASK